MLTSLQFLHQFALFLAQFYNGILCTEKVSAYFHLNALIGLYGAQQKYLSLLLLLFLMKMQVVLMCDCWYVVSALDPCDYNNAGCEQLCVRVRGQLGYQCSCQNGILAPDNHTCVSSSEWQLNVATCSRLSNCSIRLILICHSTVSGLIYRLENETSLTLQRASKNQSRGSLSLLVHWPLRGAWREGHLIQSLFTVWNVAGSCECNNFTLSALQLSVFWQSLSNMHNRQCCGFTVYCNIYFIVFVSVCLYCILTGETCRALCSW